MTFYSIVYSACQGLLCCYSMNTVGQFILGYNNYTQKYLTYKFFDTYYTSTPLSEKEEKLNPCMFVYTPLIIQYIEMES